MNRLRAAAICWERDGWERGGAQVGKRADGSSGGMGWAPRAMRWALCGGGECVDGLGGGEGLLAGRFVVSGGCQAQIAGLWQRLPVILAIVHPLGIVV